MKIVNSTKNYLLIETLSQLIHNQYTLHDALTLCFEIFHDNQINQLKEHLINGEPIEQHIRLIYDDALYQEFFKFYLYQVSLDKALLEALNLCKQKDSLKKVIGKALVYPILLLTGVLAFSLIAVFYLQPQFTQFFSSFNIQFSWLHQFLMRILFASPIILCLLIISSTILLAFFIKQFSSLNFEKLNPWFKHKLFRYIIKQYFTIKFCLYYKEFLDLGYDIHTILRLIGQKIVDAYLQKIVYELISEIETGKDLSLVIQDFIYFDEHFKLIFKLSLTYQNPKSLFEHYYQMSIEFIKTLIQRGINIGLPILYGFIGLYIIGIYGGMILPMMNMLDNI